MNMIKQIQEKSLVVKKLASDLSNKIVEFTEILSTLPGRVQVELDCKDFSLRFDRSGSIWTIEVSESGRPWKPLIEASLKTKMAAVNHFADLILAIVEGQKKLIEDLCTSLDTLERIITHVKEEKNE